MVPGKASKKQRAGAGEEEGREKKKGEQCANCLILVLALN